MINIFEFIKGFNKNINVPAKEEKKEKRRKRRKPSVETPSLFDLISIPKTEPKQEEQHTKPKKPVEPTEKPTVTTTGTTENTQTSFDLFSNLSKVVKPIKKKAEEIVDFFFKREPASNSKAENYKNNIAAVKVIKSIGDNRCTKAQQTTLSKYVGWGGLADKFKEGTSSCNDLKLLLGDDFESARQSTLSSFYTPIFVCKFIFKVIEKLGFSNGRILEPAAGIGRMLGSMSEEMYFNSRITAIEPDNMSFKILKNLYQSSDIKNEKFEDTDFKDESFDLIVTNVPFGDIRVFDKQNTDLNNYHFLIHDYFFAKAIKKVRDGGLIVFISSTGTMDKKDNSLRKYIDENCNLLGAVRLPYNTFMGTEVSTDIIFLQKQKAMSTEYKVNWLNVDVEENSKCVINNYYLKHPEMMLGDMEIVSSAYGHRQICYRDKQIKSSDLEKLVKYFPSEIYVNPLDDSYMYEEEELLPADELTKEGEHVLVDNLLYQKQGKNLVPCSYTGKRLEKFTLFVEIKDCLQELISLQLANCDDEQLAKQQNKLNTKYDEFVSSYGHVSERANKKDLQSDVLYFLVCSLENYDSSTKTYSKADIFTKRTIGKVEKQGTVETVEDALIISLGNYGELNLDDIASMLDRSKDDIIEEMSDKSLIFLNPATMQYEESSEYLSGFVKEKLEVAKIAAKKDPKFEVNVKALEANQPAYETDVYFSIASTWIPIDIKRKFIVNILKLDDDKLDFIYNSAVGYQIKYRGFIRDSLDKNEWGTSRRPALSVVEAALNQKDIKVCDTKFDFTKGKDIQVPNPAETQLAMAKLEQWKTTFDEYINNHTDIHKKLLDLYNEKFINYKERVYPIILSNDKIRKNANITLREHQLRAASRIILSNNNVLLQHDCGTGKTFTMVTAVMEAARINKLQRKDLPKNNNVETNKYARPYKALIVTTNTLCTSGQFAKEFLTLYPQANILACTSKDFTKANRRKIISKMVTCNWDAIIIPHSVLGLIQLKPETEREMIEQDLAEMDSLLKYYDKEGVNFSVKEIEKNKKNLEAKLDRLNSMHKDEGLLYWEDIGITNIFIDEAHNYKNLYFNTKLQVSGISPTQAQKTQDLYNKIRYQRQIYGEKGIVFATATPISNSMAELYTMLRYLNFGILEKYNVDSFDAWASTFGIIESNMEVDVTGTGFKMQRRFCKFCNVPELVNMYRSVADIITLNDVKDLDLPKLKGGKPEIVEVEPTPQMHAYIESLVDRSEAIHNGSVDRHIDNMLLVTMNGRALAVDPRLVGVNCDSPKTQKVVENVVNGYNDYPGTTQIIFCDSGTPTSNGFNVYQDIKNKLIASGIPESDIAFMHDANTPEKRKILVENMDKAKVRILLVSTALGSEGLNIQSKVKFLHHIDCPWKPANIIQRVGRMIRQGNENKEVIEYRYVVKGSFDAYSWQTVEIKAKYIDQMLHATSTSRTMDEVDSQAMSFSEAKACACGDERIMILCKVNSELQKYQLMQKAFVNSQMRALDSLEVKKHQLETVKNNIAAFSKDIEVYNSNKEEEYFLQLGDKKFKSYTDGYEALSKMMKEFKNGVWGKIYGLDIELNAKDYLGIVILIGNNYKFKIKYHAYPKLLMEDFEDYITQLNDNMDEFKKRKQRIEIEIPELEEISQNKFEYLDKIKELKIKKAELESALNLEANIK